MDATIIDPLDRLYPLSEFTAVLLRCRGVDRSYDTLHRWARGIGDSGTKKRRLGVLNQGGVMVTSLRLFDQFVSESP